MKICIILVWWTIFKFNIHLLSDCLFDKLISWINLSSQTQPLLTTPEYFNWQLIWVLAKQNMHPCAQCALSIPALDILSCSILEYKSNWWFFCSDCIGDSVIAADLRWGGSFGVNVDFVARRCSCKAKSVSFWVISTYQGRKLHDLNSYNIHGL